MDKSLDQALAYSNRWLDLIKTPVVNEAQGKQIIAESQYNFAEHFNRGWLDYRKSVTRPAIGLRPSGPAPAWSSGMSWAASTSTASAVTG